MSPSPFIETYTGVRFQPLEPRVADIWITDIAHALSHQCRFSGHTTVHYSVAEHCVRVSELLEVWGCSKAIRLWGLLHDASEAYLVDIPAPLKRHPAFDAYVAAEHDLMRVIGLRFGLADEPPIVRKADLVLLATEARDLMAHKAEHWKGLTEKPLDRVIIPWCPETAKRNFLARFEQVSQ